MPLTPVKPAIMKNIASNGNKLGIGGVHVHASPDLPLLQPLNKETS